MKWMLMLLMLGGAGHAALVVGLARYFIHPPRGRIGRTPADIGLAFREITVASADGFELKGWYVPGTGPAGIVLCHGFAANRTDLLVYLPWLHRAGFHVLTFDFRAAGESRGDVCTFGLYEKRDVEDAARLLVQQPGVDAHRIGAMGLSMGGATVLLAAAETPSIRAVVTDSAFARLDEMVAERFRLVPAFYRGTLSSSVRFCAERWAGYDSRDVVPVEAIRHIAPRPVFLIHGPEDHLVPVRHARMLREAAGGPVELWEVPGAGHVGCHATAPEEYERRVVGFFRGALCAGPE
jgi:dipeptidyl aminopeptidase/acylaminoacyl peptidase